MFADLLTLCARQASADIVSRVSARFFPVFDAYLSVIMGRILDDQLCIEPSSGWWTRLRTLAQQSESSREFCAHVLRIHCEVCSHGPHAACHFVLSDMA